MSTIAATKKAEKKVKDFFKEREKISKRFKALAGYLDDAPEKSQADFFSSNYEMIFAVFLARFEELEKTKKEKKHQKRHGTDTLMTLKVLKLFLIFLPQLIKKRWQFANIARIIEKSVNKSNKQTVRELGFEILLLFIEVLQNSIDDQIHLFANVLNLQPFLKIGGSDRKGRMTLSPEEAVGVLCPASQHPSTKDAIELLDNFFDFLSLRTGEKFEFWYDIWKENYYTTFYPEFAKKHKVVEHTSDTRFQTHCPWDVQRCLVERLERWLELPSVAKSIWSASNGPLLLEILRQTCCLPIYYSSTTKLSISTFKKYLLNQPPVVVIEETELQQYYRDYIQHLSLVFLVDSTPEEVDKHSNICADIRNIYDFFSKDMARKISAETWKCLQITLLDTTHALLSKAEPFSNTIAEKESNPMLELLYLIWLRSPHTTEDMWKQFNDRMATLLHWKQVVQQWKDTLLQLTYILIDFWYPEEELSSTNDVTSDRISKPDEKESIAKGKGPIGEEGSGGAGSSGNTGDTGSPRKLVGTATSATGGGATSGATGGGGGGVGVVGGSENDKSSSLATSGGSGGGSERSASRTLSTGGSSGLMTSGSSKTLTSRIAKQTRDRNYSLNWDKEKILHAWSIILRILGNPCNIENPPNFALGVSCLSQVVELFLVEEAKLELDQTPTIPIFEIFLSWLLELCGVGDKRNKGRLSALSTLCKMFCRPHQHPLDMVSLSHFYRVIQSVLSLNHSSVVWIVLRHASTIFTLHLPGVSILIGDFVREVDRLWTRGATGLPTDIQRKALLIMQSILCYTTHYSGLDLPGISLVDMQKKMMDTMINAVNYKDIAIVNKVAGIKCLCVMVYDQMLNTPLKNIVGECVKTIVASCANKDDIVTKTALESVSSLSYLFINIAKVDPNIVYYTIDSLSDNIVQLISGAKNDTKIILREDVISDHFFTLLDCLLQVGATEDLQLSPAITNKVFRALEWGLLGEELMAHSMSPSSPRSSMASSGARGGGRRAASRTTTSSSSSSSSSSSTDRHTTLASMFENLRLAPTHKSDIIREAAEVFLLNVVNHFANFPSPAGPAQITSITKDELALSKSRSVAALREGDDKDTVYFVYNRLTIFALRELEVGKECEEPTVRMTIRDCTGKYVWDFNVRYDIKPTVIETIPTHLLPKIISSKKKNILGESTFVTTTVDDSLSKDKEIARERSYTRRPSEPPLFEVLRSHNTNPLEELLNYMDEVHTKQPELQPLRRKSFAEPMAPSEAYKVDLAQLLEGLTEQSKIIKERCTKVSHPHIHSRPLSFSLPKPEPVKFHYCRMLLSHLGLLAEENRNRLSFLENNKRFQRSLKELDKVNGREVAKIGLLYVREGQENQYDILKNDMETRSKEYQEFVSGLGWMVDLATHRGFRGGLDVSSFTAGTMAPYWASSTMEVIFHDITLMPTKKSDHQQIHKKRHVGNDIVHVIWTEHQKDYEPGTITSQFNDVHIVVIPMRNGLFQVRIQHKENVPPFGPLHDGMVLSKKLLSQLIRLTAINANRAVRSFKKEYKRPFPSRGSLISEMCTRYKAERSFEDYFLGLLPELAEKQERSKSPPPRSTSPPPRSTSPPPRGSKAKESIKDIHST